MIGWRITPRILTFVQKRSFPDLRTYRVLAPYASCIVTETKEFKQQTLLPRTLVPVNCHSGVLTNLVSTAFSSKAAEDDAQSPEQEADPHPEPESTDPVRLLYTFRHIRTARTVTKVKIFQTVLVTAALPYLYGGYLNGVVSAMQLASSFFIMTFATAMLYVIGDTVRKTICIMKYNKDTDEVLISHLNFWGRRRDIAIPLTNIVPVSDSSENTADTYILVKTYDKSEAFMIFMKDASEEEKKDVLKVIG